MSIHLSFTLPSLHLIFPSPYIPLTLPSPCLKFLSPQLPLTLPTSHLNFPSLYLPLTILSPHFTFPSPQPSSHLNFPSSYLPGSPHQYIHFASCSCTLFWQRECQGPPYVEAKRGLFISRWGLIVFEFFSVDRSLRSQHILQPESYMASMGNIT